MRYLIAAAVLGLVGSAVADTINVPADYATIQGAVDAAVGGDEVVVAPGTYTSTQDGYVVDMLGKAITLRSSGGADVTIIDGEGERRGIACFNGETTATVIDGFTITNGLGVPYDFNDDGDISSWEDEGGGIYCYDSSPMLSGCTISGNTADRGGGIYCYNNSNPTISGCTISDNTATASGGGIYCNSSSPTISSCTISGNTATGTYGKGGGIYFLGSDPTITNCEIANNTADYGGGIYFLGSDPTITNCEIANNTADYGGGIYCAWSNTTITGCTISNNTADYGGGIFCEQSNPTLTDTNVCGNDADQIYGDWTNGGGACIAFACEDWDGDGVPDKCQGSIGDGIHEVPSEYATIQSAIEAAGYGDTVLVGPGTYTSSGDWVINPGGKPITIRSTDGPEVTILDGEGARRVLQCAGGETAATIIDGFTITGGSAGYGGGIYCYWGSNPTLTDCTISGNTADYYGGGIACSSSNPTLSSCTISGNTADNYNGGGIYCYYNSSPTLSGCTISGNIAANNGGGIYCNDSSSPTLAHTTVCSNAPNQISGDWTDNGGNDIADECTDCPDINGDGEVGVDEILAVIAAWDTDDADADVNDDGIVDTNDILAVLSAWGPCP